MLPLDVQNLILAFADEKDEKMRGLEITEAIQEFHPVKLNNNSNYPNYTINKILAAWGYGPNDLEFIINRHVSIVRGGNLSEEYSDVEDIVMTKKALLIDAVPDYFKPISNCIEDIAEAVCVSCGLEKKRGFMCDFMIFEYFFPEGRIGGIDYDAFELQAVFFERRPEFLRRVLDFNFIHKKKNWVQYTTGKVLEWDAWVAWRRSLC